MSQAKFTVRIMDVTSKAADGSTVPRSTWETYLSSPSYHDKMSSKTAVGGLSHKDRRLKPELKGLIGMDDQVLINDNALFYTTKLYFKPGSNFLYADAVTFDPELFDGKRRENINNIIGMLESGMICPISMVLQALWSRSGEAAKIINFKGFDFTQNPSFRGAGLEADSIKIFSETIEDSYRPSNEEIRTFSETYPDAQLKTVVFSSTGEISIKNDDSVKGTFENNKLYDKIMPRTDEDTVTYSDIVSVYGQGSTQERLARGMQGKNMTREDLVNLAEGNEGTPDAVKDDANLNMWINAVKGIASNGEDDNGVNDRLKMIFRSNRDKLHNIINSVPNSDPRKDKLIEARLQQYFRILPQEQLKGFSVITSVGDRIRNQQQPRYTKIERIIKAYTNFKNQKKLGEDQLLSTKLLFLQDINLLVKEVLPQLKAGQTLNSLYGLNRYGDAVKKSGIELSTTYRKVLIAQGIMQFVPKALYGEWVLDIQEFYNNLLIYTFGEGLTQFQLNLIDLK